MGDTIPVIVWIATPTQATGVEHFNKRWMQHTGQSYEESLGWGWVRALHEDDALKCKWQNMLLNSTEGFEIEQRIFRASDQTYRWHQIRALPLRDPTLKWFGTAVDIDDQKQAEKVLIAARKAAEEAVANQELFLANMSHEIRTPLNGLSGMIQLLSDTPLVDEQRDYIATMQRSMDALLQIINDILDFSKIRAGGVVLERQRTVLEQVIDDVRDLVLPLAEAKNLRLPLFVDQNVPLVLLADSGRLRQILINIIGNAIKFTEHGQITIRCECLGEYEKSPSSSTLSSPSSLSSSPPSSSYLEAIRNDKGTIFVVRFTITDTGCGIKEQDIPRLFDSFYQGDISSTKKHSGTGLGLAISKRLVDLFGGKIAVKSVLGEGTTFEFTICAQRMSSGGGGGGGGDHSTSSLSSLSSSSLPSLLSSTTLSYEDAPAFAARAKAHNITCVVACSHPTSLLTHSHRMESLGLTVQSKIGSVPMMQSFITSSSSSPPSSPTSSSPSSLLCDVMLVDLFDLPPALLSTLTHLVRIIIFSTGPGEHGPLVDSSSPSAAADDGAGVAKLIYIARPITKPKLMACIQGLLVQKDDPPIIIKKYDHLSKERKDERKEMSSSSALSPLRILVVEDNGVNQKVMKRFLEVHMKAEAIVVGDGAQAVRLVTSHVPEYFSLILMDLFMPVIDGFQATMAIRSWEAASNDASTGTAHHVPIVVVSANVMNNIAAKCMEAGCDAFVSKPVQFSSLAQTINRLTATSQQHKQD